MKIKRIDRDFKDQVETILSMSGGRLVLVNGGRHPAIYDTVTHTKNVIPGSSSDHRALKNWKCQIRRWLRTIGFTNNLGGNFASA